jgi:multidrug resistance efflux pump
MNSSPSTKPKISTPIGRRFQRVFVNWLPGVSFVLMCLACAWLLRHQSQSASLVGEVEVAEFVVVSPQAGIINHVLPGLHEGNSIYAPVTKGQLVVRLDDSAVRGQLDSLQSELISLSQSAAVELARIDSMSPNAAVPVAGKARQTVRDDQSNADLDEQSSRELAAWRLGASMAEVQLKELELIRTRLDQRNVAFQLAAVSRSAGGSEATTDNQALKTDLAKRKTELDLAIAKLSTDLSFGGVQAGASASGDMLAKVDDSDLSAAGRSLFRSFRHRCQLVYSQLQLAAKSAQSLDVLSPADGQIDQTHVAQLQSIVIGEPIATIVPTRGEVVVAYAREQSRLRPFVGMPVTLRSSSDPAHSFAGVVESVGPKVESVPTRQRANPRVEEWGRPGRIRLPKELAAEPGSLLEIVFRRAGTAG